jgi:hypothetical protein
MACYRDSFTLLFTLTASDTDVDKVIKNNVKYPGPQNINLELIKHAGRKVFALVTY